MIRHIPHYLMACMAASGTGSLVFIDDVADRSSRMNSGVCRATLYSDRAKSCKNRLDSASQCKWKMTPKQTAKATQKFIKAEKRDILQYQTAKSVTSSQLNPSRAVFHLINTKLKAEIRTARHLLLFMTSSRLQVAIAYK